MVAGWVAGWAGNGQHALSNWSAVFHPCHKRIKFSIPAPPSLCVQWDQQKGGKKRRDYWQRKAVKDREDAGMDYLRGNKKRYPTTGNKYTQFAALCIEVGRASCCRLWLGWGRSGRRGATQPATTCQVGLRAACWCLMLWAATGVGKTALLPACVRACWLHAARIAPQPLSTSRSHQHLFLPPPCLLACRSTWRCTP